jgi:hypothetical protein
MSTTLLPWTSPFWNEPNLPFAIHLIRRPKLANPVAWHYAVAIERFPGFPSIVYDLVQHRGFGRTTLEEFLQGRPVETVRSLSDEREIRAAWGRLYEVIAGADDIGYAIANQNCEHVARYIVSGRPTSTQVGAVVAVACIAAFSFIVLRDAA